MIEKREHANGRDYSREIAESREQREESREQRAESESREQRAGSREQRAESREQRAESRVVQNLELYTKFVEYWE
jgi:hypothetical protein